MAVQSARCCVASWRFAGVAAAFPRAAAAASPRAAAAASSRAAAATPPKIAAAAPRGAAAATPVVAAAANPLGAAASVPPVVATVLLASTTEPAPGQWDLQPWASVRWDLLSPRVFGMCRWLERSS